MQHSNRFTTLFFISIIAFATLLAACQGAAQGPKISVEGVWGRQSPKMATAGAFYMTISNTGNEADKLIKAVSDACGTVELHESYMDANGVMGMRPVEGGSIEIPAGGKAELKVGGLHVMCIDKLVDFTAGNKLEITLQFEKSGEIVVEAEIKEQ